MLPPSNYLFAFDEKDGNDEMRLAGNLNLSADVSCIVEICQRYRNVNDE